MPKNLLLDYLSSIHNHLEDAAHTVDHYIYEYDDGEQRNVSESKSAAMGTLQEVIDELNRLKTDMDKLSHKDFNNKYFN